MRNSSESELFEQVKFSIESTIKNRMDDAFKKTAVYKAYETQKQELEQKKKECQLEKNLLGSTHFLKTTEISTLEREKQTLKEAIQQKTKELSSKQAELNSINNLMVEEQNKILSLSEDIQNVLLLQNENRISEIEIQLLDLKGKADEIFREIDELTRQERRHTSEISQKHAEITQKFEETWTTKYQPIFQEYLKLNYQTLEAFLLRYHGWLKSQTNTYLSGTIIYTLLRNFLNDHVLKDLEPIRCWSQEQIEQIDENSLHFTLIDEQAFKQFIFERLFTSALINPRIISSFRHNGWTSSSTTWPALNNVSRFDVLRFLSSHQMRASVVMNVEELLQYEDRINLNSAKIFLNLGAEVDSKWVFIFDNKVYLCEEDAQWFGEFCRLNPSSVISKFTVLTFDVVKLYQNFDETFQCPPECLWPVFLFSRIFPAVVAKKSVDTYRQFMSPMVLLEETLKYFGDEIKVTNIINLPYPVESSLAASSKPYFDHLQKLHADLHRPYLFGEYNNLSQWIQASNKYDYLFSAGMITLSSKGTGTKYTQLLFASNRLSAKNFFQAIELTERNRLNTVVFQGLNFNIEDDPSPWKILVNDNVVIKEVQFLDLTINAVIHDVIKDLVMISARNRFLSVDHSDYLTHKKRSLATIRYAKEIVEFFTKNSLHLDDIEQLMDENQKWFVKQHPNEPFANPILWKFAQFRQTGLMGLSELFWQLNENFAKQWRPVYQEPAPRLNGLFDLSKSHIHSSKDYIDALSNNLSKFKLECAPLFQRVGLILPTELNEDAQLALVNLLEVLSQRKKANLQEPDEIEFYNLNLNSTYARQFLMSISRKLHVSICIPAWDRDVSRDAPEIMNLYRDIQNILEQNLRKNQSGQALVDTSEHIKAYDENRLEASFERHAKLDEIAWDEVDDKVYTLSSAIHGTQQQLQLHLGQELEEQVVQEVQQEVVKEVDVEIEREIHTYSSPNRDFVTYDNIDIKGETYWHQLPAAIHQSVGNLVSLKELFVQWTGSSRRAPEAISYIEMTAMQKLMDFASVFRAGVDWNHTPGFRVEIHPDDGAYILTYSEKRAKEDLVEEQNKIRNDDRDPFFIQLKAPKPHQIFRGDYRQFNIVTDESSEQKRCWLDLAKEDENVQRKNNLNNFASASLHPTIDYQQWVCRDESSTATDVHCILKNWILRNIADQAFADAFLLGFTSQQLQALGQLFNHYQYDANTGAVLLLQISYRIYANCPEWFDAWKQQFLILRSDWTSLLDDEEVKATLRAINTLNNENNKPERRLFAAIINAHGYALGDVAAIRMSEIWYAFEKVVVFCVDNDLEFNEDCYDFAVVKDFNATLFLKRLYFSLHALLGRLDSKECQQHLLSNLRQFDCTSAGFDYAIRVQKYPWVTPRLQLSNLDHLDGSIQDGSYAANFDMFELASIRNPKTYALRYVTQHMKFTWESFQRFEEWILADECFDNIYWLRLVIASLMIGQDELSKLNGLSFEGDVETLININKAIRLVPQQTNNYQLRLADLTWVAKDFSITSVWPLEKINLLGKTLHAFEIMGQYKEKAIINDVLNDITGQAQLYPWAWSSIDKNVVVKSELKELLSSIQLRYTQWLPSARDIQAANEKPIVEVMREWQDKGCCFLTPENQYRLLEQDEKDEIIASRKEKFLPIFSEGNKNLFRYLLDRLAIYKGRTRESQIDALCNLFAKLDTKNWFNELGQVLGMLFQTADNKHYNVEQLTKILELFFDKNRFKTMPYPVDFVRTVLDFCKTDHQSQILNTYTSMQYKTSDFSVLENYLQQLMQLPLAYSFQKSLIHLVIVHQKNPRFREIFRDSLALFTTLQQCPQPSIRKLVEEKFPKILEESQFELLNQLIQMIPVNNEDDYFQALKINILNAWSQGMSEDEALNFLEEPRNIHYILRLTQNCPAFENSEFRLIVALLQQWQPIEIDKLVAYYKNGPYPSWSDLTELLEKHQTFDHWVHEFETQKMPGDKRHYSLNEQDKNELTRVLTKIKRNKKHPFNEKKKSQLLSDLYYVNSFSETQKLSELPMADLLEGIHLSRREKASLDLMAYLREVLVRKTGKWVNHTQMLDLIIASELTKSFVTQLGTGEGKSIVTIMRVVYRALMGQMVDVFSSKESLSIRDHQEFSIFLDALHIRHCYIDSKSDPALYQVETDRDGVGAIHYMTMGNFSLFISGIFWDQSRTLDLYNSSRVAFLDEADHILLDENTLYNFSASEENSFAYNFDEWVYQEAYQFYLELVKSRVATNDSNQILISRHKEIKRFYNILNQKYSKNAPQQSTFYGKYIIPVIQSPTDNDARIALDLIIKRMIEAAHIAHHMQQDINFCVTEQLRTIGEGIELPTRFANVVIHNQVQDGSTYSDLVQQFLHVRLNREAVSKGQAPNFFVEPNTEIVISFNARFILRNFFKIIEGGTATAGKLNDLEYVATTFQIRDVTKLPTHAQRQTQKFVPVFAANHQEQRQRIMDEVHRYRGVGPVLISCEDDKAVVAMGEWLAKELNINEHEKSLEGAPSSKFIIDANRHGYKEAQVLPYAGFNQSITISSRLSRGTDIPLKEKASTKGLLVIETAPKGPRSAKQTQGRQGRNGAPGSYIEIYNYGPIEKFVDGIQLEQTWLDLHKESKDKLERKFQKQPLDEYYQALQDDLDLQKKYLNTNTYIAYTELKQKEKNRWFRLKEDVIAELSRQTIEKISKASNPKFADQIKREWQQIIRAIETAWHRRMTDSGEGSPQDIFNDFITKVSDIVGEKYEVKNPLDEANVEFYEHVDVDANELANISELTSFYQTYVQQLTAFSRVIKDNDEFHQFLVGNGNDLKALYETFKCISHLNLIKDENHVSLEIFKTFMGVLDTPFFFYISMEDLNKVLKFISELTDVSLIQQSLRQVKIFFNALDALRLPENMDDLKIFSRLFFMLQTMYRNANIDDDAKLLEFSNQFMKICYAEKKLKVHHLDRIEKLFIASKEMSQYFILHTNRADLLHYIQVVNTLNNDEGLDEFIHYHHTQNMPIEIVRNVFDLQVHYPVKSDLSSYKTAGKKTHILTKQMDFLTQHPGFEAAQLDAFLALELPLSILKSISPYVSLKFLIQHLDDVKGKYDHGALSRHIELIQKSNSVFVEFLAKRAIVDNSIDYLPLMDEHVYAAWIQLFERMPLKQSFAFFTKAIELQNISLDVLAKVAEDDFQEFRMLENVNGLSPEAITFFEEKYLENNPYVNRYIELLCKYPEVDVRWFNFFDKKRDQHPSWGAFEALLSQVDKVQYFIDLTREADVQLWVFNELINEYSSLLSNRYSSDKMYALISEWSQYFEGNQEHQKNAHLKSRMKALKAIFNVDRPVFTSLAWNECIIKMQYDVSIIERCLELANILLQHPELDDSVVVRLFDFYMRRRILKESLNLLIAIEKMLLSPAFFSLKDGLLAFSNRSSDLEIVQFIAIEKMLLSPAFFSLKDGLLAFSNRSSDIEIVQCYEFLYLLSDYKTLSVSQLDILRDLYFEKNRFSLKALENVIHFAPLPESINGALWMDFVVDVQNSEEISNSKIQKYSRLFTLLKDQHDLQPQDAQQLRRAFIKWNLPDDKLLEYKDMMLLAKSLQSDKVKFNLFFSNRSEDKNNRVQLMRYFRYGLLDYMDDIEEFKNKCFDRYAQTVPTIEMSISRNDVSFMSKMQSAFINVFHTMTELVNIYKKPFHDHDEVESDESYEFEKLSFDKYQNFYNSCWFKNASRNRQANTFFAQIKAENVDALDKYYQNIFGIIFDTQTQILREDQELEKNRWFTHVNSKGHSRLYDITQQVLIETLRAFSLDVSRNLIPRDNYLNLQAMIVTHLKEQCLPTLSEQLPDGHVLKDDLEALLEIQDSGEFQDQFLEMFSKNNQVPTHLKHIEEGIRLFASTYEKCPELFASSLVS